MSKKGFKVLSVLTSCQRVIIIQNINKINNEENRINMLMKSLNKDTEQVVKYLIEMEKINFIKQQEEKEDGWNSK
jgi:predicted transcriptional regulator